jgi:hypothetical protein
VPRLELGLRQLLKPGGAVQGARRLQLPHVSGSADWAHI